VGFYFCFVEGQERPSLLAPWHESASELYRPNDPRMSATLVPTFADRRMSHGQCGGFSTAVISVF
jgi:hypothetical protein